MDPLQRRLAKHPIRAVYAVGGFLTSLALTPAPPFIPLVAALTCLVYTTRNVLEYPHAPHLRLFASIIFLTVTSSAATYAPSIAALDSRSLALTLLLAVRFVTTLIAVGTIWASEKLRKDRPWIRVDLFPAVWTTTWTIVAKLSPLGRLNLWSPLDHGPYDWTRKYFGVAGVDWIVAWWALVLANVAQRLLAELREEAQEDYDSEEEPPLVEFETGSDGHLEANQQHPQQHQIGPTGAWRNVRSFYPILLLLSLAFPYRWPSIPQPTYSPNTTPLTVGCILPPGDPLKHPLDRYLDETIRWASQGKVFLWPENAVRFENKRDQEEAIEKVTEAAGRNGIWIGMSFEAPVDLPESGRQRSGMRQSGMMLIDRDGVQMEYYKTHLVPITESFSLIPSIKPAPLYELPLHPPKNIPPGEWTPNKPHIRPIPITSLICLDLAHPVPSLPARPALILAPARTWDPEIGYSMFQAARIRAEETGSKVVWCDGGDGAVNGIAGGDGGILQRGPKGTWIYTLALPWPYPERRTIPGVAGDWAAVGVVWLLLGIGLGLDHKRFGSIQLEEAEVEEEQPAGPSRFKRHLDTLRRKLTPTWESRKPLPPPPTANLIDDS